MFYRTNRWIGKKSVVAESTIIPVCRISVWVRTLVWVVTERDRGREGRREGGREKERRN